MCLAREWGFFFPSSSSRKKIVSGNKNATRIYHHLQRRKKQELVNIAPMNLYIASIAQNSAASFILCVCVSKTAYAK